MSEHTNNVTGVERFLAFASLSIIAVAILSFFATLIAALAGVEEALLAEGFWPVVTWIGYVGLPVGFVLIIVLLITTMRRRKREYLNDKR